LKELLAEVLKEKAAEVARHEEALFAFNARVAALKSALLRAAKSDLEAGTTAQPAEDSESSSGDGLSASEPPPALHEGLLARGPPALQTGTERARTRCADCCEPRVQTHTHTLEVTCR
jgi:hypothetical protein